MHIYRKDRLPSLVFPLYFIFLLPYTPGRTSQQQKNPYLIPQNKHNEAHFHHHRCYAWRLDRNDVRTALPYSSPLLLWNSPDSFPSIVSGRSRVCAPRTLRLRAMGTIATRPPTSGPPLSRSSVGGVRLRRGRRCRLGMLGW